jgi:hypothetical protein
MVKIITGIVMTGLNRQTITKQGAKKKKQQQQQLSTKI